MPIFQIEGRKLKKLNLIPVDKEKTLQKLVEENLNEVLDMVFLASEYTTTFGQRIDTLAVDANGAPVIIEYKRNQNDNVINQALSYLKWLKSQQPGFFEKLIQDNMGDDACKIAPVDWRNPRVICIAESFSKFDKDTAEVVPLRIELMQYRYYDNSVFSLEPVVTGQDLKPYVASIPKAFDKSEAVEKSPSVDALLEKASSETRNLFAEFRERVLAIDDSIEEKATKLYVAYRRSKIFTDVLINKNGLKILLRPTRYEDPKNLVEQVPETFNWTLDRRVDLKDMSGMDDVLALVEQSYKDVL